MNIYAEKKKYIEGLNQTLSVLQDFDSVSYAWDALKGSEYVKLTDTLGGYACIDVTGTDIETIFKNIIKTLLLGDTRLPVGIVHERDTLREIAHLFGRSS